MNILLCQHFKCVYRIIEYYQWIFPSPSTECKCLPFTQGVLVTTHFLFSVSGEQAGEGEAGDVSMLWTCGSRKRTRDCEPFLNPHVLFFFMQELHWLHSDSSQSPTRGPETRDHILQHGSNTICSWAEQLFELMWYLNTGQKKVLWSILRTRTGLILSTLWTTSQIPLDLVFVNVVQTSLIVHTDTMSCLNSQLHKILQTWFSF